MIIRPVILGGDIGGYSLSRTFNEALGVKAIVISTVRTVPLRYSRILHNIVEPNMADIPYLVQRLRQIAQERPEEKLILLGTSDWHVRTIVENRQHLEDLYTIPYVPLDIFDMVTSKERFAQLCRELDIAHPQTLIHDVQHDPAPDLSEFTFPLIAKAADTSAYHDVEFPGKKKVFEIASQEELFDVLEKVKAAGYQGTFIIQDFIPGDDSGMRILTLYSDKTAKVRFASFGRVLLEEHTPGALGNPVGIITTSNEEAVEQATRLVERVGWTGFSNFDLKYDPRTGKSVFFELNPRLGRSNYYITGAGSNTANFYVREFIQGLDPLGPDQPDRTAENRLYHVVPIRILQRYLVSARLRARVRWLTRSKRSVNVMWNPAEKDPRRWLIVAIAQYNHFRKFKRHLPVPEARSLVEAKGGFERV